MRDCDDFFSDLKAKRVSAFVCFAMCALSMAFSSHDASRYKDPKLLDADFWARESRQGLLVISRDKVLEQLHTYAILIDYEIQKGRGAQALCDCGE